MPFVHMAVNRETYAHKHYGGGGGDSVGLDLHGWAGIA